MPSNLKSLTVGGVPITGVNLPPITGTYFHVCPGSSAILNTQSKQIVGSSGNDGLLLESALDSIVTAYNNCTSGAGDGIVIWNYGTSTAMTTSYLTAALTWAKSGITVVGVCPPVATSQRSRIASASTATSLANMITVSGNDNRFYNFQTANWGSNAAALGNVVVTGNRNYFENVHIAGPGHATPAQTTGSYALSLSGAQENRFVGCTIGLDTVDQDGSQAVTGVIKFASDCQTNRFEGCTILTYYSYASSTCGAIHHVGAGDSISRTQFFKDCTFINYKLGLPTTTPPLSLVVGTAPNNGVILLDKCTMLGYAAYDGTAANDRVFVTTSQSYATGGLAVVTA